MQAKLMWIMPLAFSVMFIFFPAGLVLYWITNNMLSIAQQWFINKRLACCGKISKLGATHASPRLGGRAIFLTAGRIVSTLARPTDPIVAIATAPGRGAVGDRARVGRARWRRSSTALRARAASRARPPTCPSAMPMAKPIDRGLAHALPRAAFLHRRRRARAAGARRRRWCCSCCSRAASKPRRTDRRGQPRLAGLRVAEPGEFSQRAFLNGKIDLAQAEAIADLIDASTEAAARSAGRSLVGRLLAARCTGCATR